MEDRRAVAAPRRALVAALIALAGCQGGSVTKPPLTVVTTTPPRLAITQRVDARGPRYVLCTEHECPLPTPKVQAVVPHLPRRATMDTASTPRSAAAASIDIPFAFNAMRVRTPDLVRLRSTLAGAHGTVTIVGRSDFVGSRMARQRIAQARAQAVRAAIHDARPDLEAHVKLDIASAPPDPASSRALQRRATIVFTPPSNQP